LAADLDAATHTAMTGLRRIGYSWSEIAARLDRSPISFTPLPGGGRGAAVAAGLVAFLEGLHRVEGARLKVLLVTRNTQWLRGPHHLDRPSRTNRPPSGVLLDWRVVPVAGGPSCGAVDEALGECPGCIGTPASGDAGVEVALFEVDAAVAAG
jgi:hypothetical protein